MERRVKSKNQAGYVLILTLLGLLTMTGFVATGFIKEAHREADQARYLKHSE